MSALTTQPRVAAQARPDVDPPPDLSVIVVTHNRSELALATLHSARAAAEGLHVQWLLIDSGSSDGTPEAIERRFPDVSVQRCANVGFAAANNRALPQARGRYVLLLNPDVEILTGSFAELLAALDAQPHVGVASVIQQGSDAQLQHSIRSYPSPRRALGEALGLPWDGWREEERSASRYRHEYSADWLVGAFLLARADVVRQIGGLDERFFLYSEETDWCYRARAAGWDVRHLPHMTITHHTTPSTKPELVAQLSYAKLLFARKHYHGVSTAAIRVALGVRHLTRALALAGTGGRGAGAGGGGGDGGGLRGHAQGRLGAELHALRVVAGVAPPPFPHAGART